MKLRNKKTGKIWHMPRLRQPTVQEDDISFFACIGEHGCSRCELFSYKSLAELNAEWEDYIPAEPLIKDEKIRKAVRAWAKASGIEKVLSYGDIFWIGFRSINTESVWKFECNYIDGSEFQQDKEYTIAELCGEEEE
jgi:hypothetical protein